MSTPFDSLPGQVRFLWKVILLDFALLAAYRVLFWAWFRSTGRGGDRGRLARALGIGLRFDLRLSILLALPVLALGWVPGVDPGASEAAARWWRVYLTGTWALVTAVYLVDAAHYDYLHCRLNATVVENLSDAGIAVATGWESFPVARGAAALLLLAGLHAWLVEVLVLGTGAGPAPPPPGWTAAAWTATGLALAAGLYGRAAWFPLRWSDAFFTTDTFLSALALNPVLFLWSTWDNRRTAADPEAVRASYDEVARVLGVRVPDAAILKFTREVPARTRPPTRPNVVVILLESYAGYKQGAMGNPLGPTPHFDALAKDSLLFTNFFAVSGPTARAVFTLLTGIPDVNPVHAASRNPLAVRQRTLVNSFEGYEKMYLIGGSASWGNVRGVLSHNIPDIRIHEEGDYDAPRNDGWGISDLDLLLHAHGVFRTRQGPFVAFVHTAGNHRPWTIPRDRRGFETVSLDEGLVQENGFDSVAEFNSFRFMDHSLGLFFEAARREDYYRNTIFLLLGDHGNPTPRQTPWERLGLAHVHTPLLVHGPAFLPPPGRRDTVMSSVDVLPTALGLAGLPYENTTLGRDVFEERPDAERFAFVRIVPRFGLVGPEFFLSLRPDGTTALFPYRSDRPEDVKSLHRDEAERMERLCRGFLETSRFLLQRDRADERAVRGAR